VSARVLVALALVVVGCDNRQAFHEPEPGLERMLEQPRVDPYMESAAFADGRGMRTPPQGTLPRGWVTAAVPLVETGKLDGHYADKVPIPVTRALLERGRNRFEVQCGACHGLLGDGHSVTATKMVLRPPPTLLSDDVRAYPPGRLYELITVGYGLMPSYAAYLSVEERWAVVGYVGALQLSQRAKAKELPPDVQQALEEATR
jgi:mono/diheme cytochrome c family protein